MEKPSVLLACPDPEREGELFALLEGVARLLVAEPLSVVRTTESHRRYNPQLAIVVMGSNATAALDVVEALAAMNASVLVVGPRKDPDLILGVMRAGAREFVLGDEPEELRRAVLSQARSTMRLKGGNVVAVFGAKGGVGATAVATNMAGALARGGHRTVLVDLNLHMGDALSFLELAASHSVSDVVRNMERFDGDLLDTALAKHPCGLRVLAQSGKVEDADSIRSQDVSALLEFLRLRYDRVVVDGLRTFDGHALAALDGANRILLVLTQDVPAVRNAQRCLDIFKRLGYESGRVRLVLNRHVKTSRITAEVIEDALGQAPSHVLSNDFAAVVGAINRGELLVDAAPRSRLTRDIDGLVALVGATPQRPPTRSSLLGIGRRKRQ